MSAFDQPVSSGDVLDVTIAKESDRGEDAIAYVDGLVVFVPGADLGDEVTIRVEKVTENCAFAEVWEA